MIENHGDRCAAVKDPFGNDWYVGTHLGRSYVPEGLRDVTIYLHPLGAARPIDFLKAAFAAEEFRRYDSPHFLRYALQPMPTGIYRRIRRSLAFRARASALRLPSGGGAGLLRKPVVHPNAHWGHIVRGAP
jgi:hypothetical protein